MKTNRDEIIDFIKKKGKPQTIKEISEGMGKSRSALSHILRKMWEQHQIKKIEVKDGFHIVGRYFI